MAIIDSVKLPDNSTYDLTDNYSGYQKATLATPITVNGTQETTVEGALGGLNDYGNALKGELSHENLVDNPFFTVNQRGFTSGDFAVSQYCVDRWIRSYQTTSSGAVSVTSSGITLNKQGQSDVGFLYQNFEKFTTGKTYTLSVKFDDGTVESATASINSTSDRIDIIFSSGKGSISFEYVVAWRVIITVNAGYSITLRAVKLELGTVSTLANDVEPNKNVETIKCQNPLRIVGTPNVYRGQEITLNADFWAHIADGTFENQQVGDTITLNGRKYTLAHANYWLHTGDTACETNHWVVISPNLGNISMNSDNSTAGGYLGSGFRSGTNHDSTPNTALANCIAAIKSDFGASHILSHREFFDNAVTGGYPSSGAWVDSEAELMSQIMAYGNRFFDPSTDLGATIPALYSIDKSQLALYAQRPDLLTDGSNWWLRDVVSAACFAHVSIEGATSYYNASSDYGVRLVFGIIA